MSSSLDNLRLHLTWAVRELRVHPTRTLVTTASIALATTVLACVVGFFQGYRESLQRSIDELGFEVLVTAKGCPYEAATLVLAGGRIPMYIDSSLAAQVRGMAEVSAVTPLFLQTVKRADEEGTLCLTGVDLSYRQLKPSLRLHAGRWLADADAAEVVLGYNAATQLRLDVGDPWVIPEVNARVQVAGILDRTGGQDDGSILLPLAFAQRTFDRQNKLTGLGVKIRDVDDLEPLIASLYALPGVQVITMTQVRTALYSLVSVARTLLVVGGILALLVALGGVMNSALASVFERMTELGILKAMGARAGRLFTVIFLETELKCLLGTASGCLLALLMARGAEGLLRRTLPYVPAGPIIHIKLSVCLLLIAMGMLLGLCACLWPALKAARLKPAWTMRGYE